MVKMIEKVGQNEAILLHGWVKMTQLVEASVIMTRVYVSAGKILRGETNLLHLNNVQERAVRL